MATYEVGDAEYELPDDLPPEQLDKTLRALARQHAGSQLGPLEGAARFFGQGANVGMADVLGAPVDAATWLLNAPLKVPLPDLGMSPLGDTSQPGQQSMQWRSLAERGVPTIARPYGGSERSRSGLASIDMGYENLGQVPERFRPFAVGGEAVGGSVPFAAAPYLKAAQLPAGAQATGITAPIVNTAANSPRAFATAEAGAAAGAGIGAGIAENVAPGSAGARFAGEAVGGVISPIAVFTRAARGITKGVKGALQSLTRTGREGAAGARVQALVRDMGEDPQALASALDADQAVAGAPYTAGQKANSLALLALERRLLAESKRSGIDVRRQTQTAIDDINAAFREAVAGGDPQALREVAKARQQYWDALIEARIGLAQERAARAARSIEPSSPTARRDANLRARRLLEDALDDARAHESQLWNRVDRDIEIRPSELAAGRDRALAELLPEETLPLPANIRAALDRMVDDGTATAGDMLRLRSLVLQHSRTLRRSAAPDHDAIRRLRILDEAVISDLAQAGGAATEARGFTRALNERFGETAVGPTLGENARSGPRVEPEMTLEPGARGGAAGDVHLRQLEEGATPLAGMEPTDRAQAMHSAQEQVLRDEAARVIDPSGDIRPDRLAQFRRRHGDTLRRFPEVAEILEAAERAQRRAGNTITGYDHARTTANKVAAFARVAGVEDPATAMAAAIRSKNPRRELSAVFRLAGRDKAARAGARVAFFDTLFEMATQSNGLISGTELRRLLDKDGLGAIAARHHILDAGQRLRLNRIATEAARVEKALGFSGSLDEVADSPSAMFDMMARLIGANVGSQSAVARTSGAGLVMAGAGSRVSRRILEKVPASRMTDVLMEAVQNPRLMAALLRKAKTEKQAAGLARQVNGFLLQAGIIDDDDGGQ
jgi:hypothetical protein